MDLEPNKLLAIAESSPALKYQETKKLKFLYPPKYEGKVPLKVLVNKRVYSALGTPGVACAPGEEYYAWVNSYGAVSAIMSNGKTLGLVPSEFEVVKWHSTTPPTS